MAKGLRPPPRFELCTSTPGDLSGTRLIPIAYLFNRYLPRQSHDNRRKGRYYIEQSINEALALKYQQGDPAALALLWEGVERFVNQQAGRFSASLPPERGVTEEDLKQTGFIAVADAAERYDINGGANFVTYLGYYLKMHFQQAAGYHVRRPDPLNDSRTARLDTPLDADDAEGDTLGDALPDDRVDVDAAVVEGVYQEQLRAALDDAMNDLPAAERDVLERRYYRAEGRKKIAASLGLPDVATVTRRERSALDHLAQGACGRALEAFLRDETDPYHGISYGAFARSGASSVENTVFRRDRLRRKWKREAGSL